MTSAKIRHIITQGEGLTVEFKMAKAGLPDNLFETICAFLNSGGGTILGTGIRRVFHYIKAYSGSDRVEFLDEDLFVVKVPLASPVEKTVEKTVEKILSLIMLNSQITQQELIDKTGLTRRGIEWNLKKLKAGGRIRRIGPDKGGHWEVIAYN